MVGRENGIIRGVLKPKNKEVNQAVRNNPGKFPAGYVFELNGDEVDSVRSKLLTLEDGCGKDRHSKHGYKVFTA